MRFGDADPTGRARFDAVARYLQDVAGEDNDDAGVGGAWVVRRTVIEVNRSLRLREAVRASTWCSGLGRRWTERRVSLAGELGGLVEAATLWVHVDPASGAPAPFPDGFLDRYGAAAAGRQVGARLRHGDPPDDAQRSRWDIRRADLDVFDHVNNAAAWAMVEEFLDRDASRRVRAELEHRRALQHGLPVELRSERDPDGSLRLWALQPAEAGQPPEPAVSASVSPLGG